MCGCMYVHAIIHTPLTRTQGIDPRTWAPVALALEETTMNVGGLIRFANKDMRDAVRVRACVDVVMTVERVCTLYVTHTSQVRRRYLASPAAADDIVSVRQRAVHARLAAFFVKVRG
jgi:hypothetical protein